MINRQEILNKVYTFMMKQNQKCMKPGNNNYQYHYQRLRCNAGVLIPIEDYKPEFEEDDLCWLWNLQLVHDDYEVNE